MSNKYSGICYVCGKDVPPRAGCFQRHRGGWLVVHHQCAKDRRASIEARSKRANG